MSEKPSENNYYSNLIEKVKEAGYTDPVHQTAFIEVQEDIRENIRYVNMMKKWTDFMEKAFHLAEEGYFGDDFDKDENFYVQYIDEEEKVFLRVESPKFINRKANHKSGEVIFKKKQSMKGTEWKTCKFSDLFLPIRQSKSTLDVSMQKAIGNHLLALVVHKENLALKKDLNKYSDYIQECISHIKDLKPKAEKSDVLMKKNSDLLKRFKAYNNLSWIERLFSKI